MLSLFQVLVISCWLCSSDLFTSRCRILDKHLAILAKKHVETKFIKLNVEKAPFLVERLRIKVIPTLALVIDGKTKDYVVGFSDLGNTDEFSTEMLEWRLGCGNVIDYRWDRLAFPWFLITPIWNFCSNHFFFFPLPVGTWWNRPHSHRSQGQS